MTDGTHEIEESAVNRDRAGSIHIYGAKYEWLEDAKLYIDSMSSSEFNLFIESCVHNRIDNVTRSD